METEGRYSGAFDDDGQPVRPVGRIDYLGTDGNVGESIEYTSEYQFVRDIKEENYYGSPMVIVFYRDDEGNTIPQDFVIELDPPVHGIKVEAIPQAPLNSSSGQEQEKGKDTEAESSELGKILGIIEELQKQKDAANDEILKNPDESLYYDGKEDGLKLAIDVIKEKFKMQ